MRGTALVSIKADYRQSGRRVCRILNAFLIERAVDAVFRAEEKLELESGNGLFCVTSQDVDGSQAVSIEPRLIGKQPHTQSASMFGSERGKFGEVVLFQHVDAGRDLSIAVMPKALTGDGFVVAGQLGGQTSVIWPAASPRRQPHSRPPRGWR